MATTYIDAQEAKKNKLKEHKEITLTLYFGIFFDSTISKGKGRELSRLYRNKYHKEYEKSYSISSTIVEPEFLYICNENNVECDDISFIELYINVGQVVESVLSSILDIISGYSGSYNLKMEFDIYGLDSGTIASYAMGHIIEPNKDGFDKGCKELIFEEISETYINAFRDLKYKKEVNHFIIAETKSAIIRQNEIRQTATNVKENNGYVIHASVQKTFGKQTEIEQHGFSKQDVDDWLDNFQSTLDGLGLIDVYGIGPIADAINMIISLGRGKWAAAGLSLLAIIPIVGNYATGIKIAKNTPKATKIIKEGGEIPNNIIDGTKKFEQKMKADQEKMVEEMTENNIIQMSDFRYESLKTGTDSNPVFNSVGGVSGGNGNYGWGKSNVNKRNNTKTTSNSIWDDDYEEIKPIEEIDNVIPLEKVGDKDHGQERIEKIIHFFKQFKWSKQ